MKLKKMKKKDFNIFYKKNIKFHTKSLVKSDYLEKEDALKKVKKDFKTLLFKGRKTPNNNFYLIVNEQNKKKGTLWIFRDEEYLFIKDLFIRKKFRHLGYGRKTLYLIQEKAKKSNIYKIKLSFFKYNSVAKSLYMEVGFDLKIFVILKGHSKSRVNLYVKLD